MQDFPTNTAQYSEPKNSDPSPRQLSTTLRPAEGGRKSTQYDATCLPKQAQPLVVLASKYSTAQPNSGESTAEQRKPPSKTVTITLPQTYATPRLSSPTNSKRPYRQHFTLLKDSLSGLLLPARLARTNSPASKSSQKVG